VIGRAGHRRRQCRRPGGDPRAGVIVMNTPFGNSITTAEHAITLMLSLARQIPEADASTRAGKMGEEQVPRRGDVQQDARHHRLGNIGSIVRRAARSAEDEGDRLRSVSVHRARARTSASRRSSSTRWLLAARRLHHPAYPAHRQDPQHHQRAVPRTGQEGRPADQTALGASSSTRPRSARRLNRDTSPAPRLDVFVAEPATNNPLFALAQRGLQRRTSAPSTREAQENVALQVAEQMSDYLLRAPSPTAVNFPSISAEEAPQAQAFRGVGRAARLVCRTAHRDRASKRVQITYEGVVGADEYQGAHIGRDRRDAAAHAAGRERRLGADRRQGIAASSSRRRGRDAAGDYDNLITVTVTTDRQSRHVSGTGVPPTAARGIVNIKGIRMDAPKFGAFHDLQSPTSTNRASSAKFSSTLGEAGITSRPFHVGREAPARRSRRADRDRRRTAARRARQGARPTAGAAGTAAAVFEKYGVKRAARIVTSASRS